VLGLGGEDPARGRPLDKTGVERHGVWILRGRGVEKLRELLRDDCDDEMSDERRIRLQNAVFL
jgi:hypothetical protein